MYLREGMYRLVDSFRLGFLSDRIVEALCKYEKNDAEVSKKEKAVLDEGVSLIEKVFISFDSCSSAI